MSSYTISPIWGAGAQLFSNNGVPLAGGKIYTYAAGTTNPATTYTNPIGTVANTNPIVANSAGRLANEIWLPIQSSYKFVLKDSNDVLIATYDNIPTLPQPAVVNDASSVSYEPGYEVSAGNFTVGATYLITSVGSTDFVAIGAAANATGVHFTATGVGSGSGTALYSRFVQDKLRETISVLDFGADPTGVNDSTAAFQAAFDAARGANSTGAGRTVFSVYIPSYPDGFYKISDTLVIDGVHGLVIYGDNSFTQRNNYPGDNVATTVRWFGTRKPIFQLRGRTDAVSNPNFLIKIQDLTISGYESMVTPSSGVPAGMALSGIHIGNVDNFNENTLSRQVTIDNVTIINCRFGIWSGNPDGLNTDHASVNIDNCYIYNCPQAGIVWGTGNSVAAIKGCHIVLNGWGSASFAPDAYAPQIGANILVGSGYVDLISLTTAGSGVYKPTHADIYQDSGRVAIINAWSDTHGYFFYQYSASEFADVGRQIAQITGVRHWQGDMTAGNTPNSLYITAPGTVVSACSFYGNVVVQSGINGKPVFMGIQFGRAGATFTGTGVQTQRSLINIGSGPGNFAQVTMGGADSGVALTKSGDNPDPHMLFLNGAVSLFELAPSSATGTGFHWYARGDDANGAHVLYFNCYYSSAAGGYVPFQNTKLCTRLEFGGASGFRVYIADPNGSSGALTWIDAGGCLVADQPGLRDQVTWAFPQRALQPSFSSGDYWEGSVYYDTATKKLRVNVGGATWQDMN